MALSKAVEDTRTRLLLCRHESHALANQLSLRTTATSSRTTQLLSLVNR